MFTGLIQDVGTIQDVRMAGEAARLKIRTALAPQLRDGDSLAVDGACLTVTTRSADEVQVTAVAETLARTTLGLLRRGSRVHLEPALRAGDPLGGHLVQGHVDGQGRVVAVQPRGVSLEMTVAAEPDVMRYVVHKGSVALDGVSLTVAARQADRFTVALIPHTLDHTALRDRTPDSPVNLEVDILAKYVEGLLRAYTPARGITEEMLRDQGF